MSRIKHLIVALSGGGGGGTPSGVFAGYVELGGSLPTKRLDGSPLQNEDYVSPNPNIPTDEYPFTVGGLEFKTRLDKGLYISPKWYIQPGAIQDTSETPLYDNEHESLSGESTTQYHVNCEFVKAINGFVYKQSTPNKIWTIAHNFKKIYPSSIAIYDNNKQIFGGVYVPIDENSGELQFNNAISGTAIIKF